MEHVYTKPDVVMKHVIKRLWCCNETCYKEDVVYNDGTFSKNTTSGKRPCNIYPLKPHFHIEKLGYAGVYLLFLFLLQNIDCGYSLEPPRRGGSSVYPQSMF